MTLEELKNVKKELEEVKAKEYSGTLSGFRLGAYQDIAWRDHLPQVLNQLIEQLEWRKSLRGKVEGMKVSERKPIIGEFVVDTIQEGEGINLALDTVLELINQE